VIQPTAHVRTDLYVDGATVPAEQTLRVADPAQPSTTVEAIAAANDTWARLCSSVWTSDRDRAARVAARLRSGYTFVDAHGAPWLDERAPFGGLKGSGMGREMGAEVLREFMDTHSVAFPSGIRGGRTPLVPTDPYLSPGPRLRPAPHRLRPAPESG
jgi:hypothetical protein